MGRSKLGLIAVGVGLCVLLSSPPSARAQTAGTITGTVTDPTGAVVPNATVTVTNTATGVVARRLTTGSTGIYVAEALPVGTYEVAVVVSGFRRAVKSGIVLNVADRLGIDFTLEVGATTEVVEVTGAGPLIQTESGEQSQVVTTRQITEVPILGRNFLLLQQLVPGASKQVGDELAKGFYSTRGFAINGLNQDYTGYMLDGVQNTDMGNQNSTFTNPGPDVLTEFKVLTSNYSSKYGTGGGANLLAVSKSGTNEFHGSLWEFIRNDKLNAADFFLNRAGRKKSKFRYHDYGYTIGGPFYIPGRYNTDRTKTFFFWSQNWIDQRTAVPILAATPTQAMRNGDFSGFAPLRNPTNPLTKAPLTDSAGTPCVGAANQINPNCINNNTGLLFNQLFPLPNAPGFLNFVQGASQAQDWRNDMIRVDQNISEKLRVFVRYMHDAWTETDPVTQWSGSAFPTVHSRFNIPSRNLIIKLTHTLSPKVLNEISYNYASNYPSSKTVAMTILGATQRPAGYTAKNVFNENVHNFVPNMTFSGGWGGMNLLWGPWWAHHNISQFSDDFSIQAGRHSLGLGITHQFSITPVDSQTTPSRHGAYFFDGSAAGHPIADAVLGLPFTYGELQGFRQPYYNYHQNEWYVQDDWKVSDRLTLNLGVRYFYIPHAYSDALSMFFSTRYDPNKAPVVTSGGVIVPGTGDLLNGIAIAGQGVPRGFVPNYKGTIAPRFGFAWDPFGTGKTAIRGGYGMGYFRVEGNDLYRMVGNPPFSKIATFFRPPFDDPALGEAAPLRPLRLSGRDLAYRIPTVQNWSFGFQHQLSNDIRLAVSYVGSRGTHLDGAENINQPFPALGFDFDPRIACTPTTPFPCTARISVDAVRPFQGWGDISNIATVGNSIYHSLQVTVEKRLSHGLSFGSAYTWSKVISRLGNGFGHSPQNSYNLDAERGPSLFDRPHILVVNYVYELPFFRGRRGVAGAVLDRWELTGIVTFQSGFALAPGFTSATQGLATRPDRVAGVPIGGLETAEQWFNKAAFAAPPFGRFGNAGVGTIRGPGMNVWDIGIFKNFALTERLKLQFRTEMFNAFNHTNFDAVVTTVGSGAYGQVVSTRIPRIMQFALKLIF